MGNIIAGVLDAIAYMEPSFQYTQFCAEASTTMAAQVPSAKEPKRSEPIPA